MSVALSLVMFLLLSVSVVSVTANNRNGHHAELRTIPVLWHAVELRSHRHKTALTMTLRPQHHTTRLPHWPYDLHSLTLSLHDKPLP